MNKSTLAILVTGIFLGVLLGGLGIYSVIAQSNHSALISSHKNIENTSSNEPLYWVAPMDPNFKRDKPGKSPMGMDLVPVFEDNASSDSPGTVAIDSVTVNNLGVKTATVNAVIPTESINTFGKVAFAEDAIVHIHPRVAGWIDTLSVRNEGEYIEQGEPLYSLYSPELVNAQEELLIALTQSNNTLINAAKSRLMALNAPTTLIDRIQKNREVQRTITYFAPQSGYVSALNIQEGFYVTPAITMLAIANMDQVWVLAEIFARDGHKIAVGQRGVISSDYFPQTQINASIDYVYPTLNIKTRTLTARFVIDNTDHKFKPDMFTNVVINTQVNKSEQGLNHGSYKGPNNQIKKEPKIIVVPHQAIIRTGNSDRVVLALGDGKFKSIDVTLGTVFDDVVEIIEGLVEGDEVVVSAQFLLDSESSITSDFMRMTHSTGMNNMIDNITAWTSATVNEVLPDERMVNLTHGPLDAFNMMGMTMNFMVAEGIDITQFKVSQEVHVEIVKTPSGMYQIETAHFMNMLDNGGHN